MPSTPANYQSYGVNTNPAWSGLRGHEQTPSSLYLSSQAASGGPNTPNYHSGHPSLYPSLPNSGHGHSMYTNIYPHATAPRDHTPSYVNDSASTTSLSPLSSHIATPASGSSPSAAHGHQYSNSGNQAPLDRGYLGMQTERPRGNEDDPNSYSFLAQGSSSLAGSKRGHDAVATASFFEDVRRKRVAPTYDMAMAERIEQIFGPGIDDASLQDLLSNFATESMERSSDTNSPASSQHSTQHSQAHPLSKLSLPEAFKQTDLADLNAFLLQVGANAARVDSTTPNQGSQGNSAAFDFANALSSCGLTGVPGFDESLIQWPQDQDSRHHSVPSHTSSEAGQWAANNGMYGGQRPIAQLPHRNASFGYTSHQQQQVQQQQQQGPHMMYGQGPSSASFDSVRGARGPAYVPQLGPKEMSGSLYRHVEALTRAEPLARLSVDDSSLRSTHKDQSQGVDEDMEDVRRVSRSVSPASPSLSIYPRVTAGDPSRRLPSPISHERGSGSSSIASILDSPLSNQLRNNATSTASSSPSPPASVTAGNDGESVGSSPSPLYPSLSKDDSMDEIEEDVAAMDVTSSSLPSIPSQVRQSHAKLILNLLMAINFPNKRDVKLAPIKIHPSHNQGDEDMELSRTPTISQPSGGDSEGSDETETQRSTPKLDNVRNLPNIASLLNEVDTKTEVKGAGGRRIMDVDV